MNSRGAFDLTKVLAGEMVDPPPSVLGRTDGNSLLYRGKVNSIAGESESLKTWLALIAVVETICVCEHAQYIDFEDGPGGVVGRMLALGAPAARIAEYFHYVRPVDAFTEESRVELAKLVERYPASVSVLDGVTEAMTLLGLDIGKNPDAARFSNELLRPLAEPGAAVLQLDHLPKGADAQTRAAIGAVHKLNMIDGAAYTVELAEPFGRGRTGKATVRVAKDRPGFVREHARDGRLAGVLTLTSHPDGHVSSNLALPDAGQSAGWKPTEIMARVSAALIANPAGMSGAQVETAVRGRSKTIRASVDFLITEGYANVERRGPAKIYRSIKPYPASSGESHPGLA